MKRLFSTKYCISIVLVVLISCNLQESKTTNSKNLFLKYIKKSLIINDSVKFTGKILSISNNACQKCSNWILENNKNLPCGIILFYDTLVYRNHIIEKKCVKNFATNNDDVSRLNIKNINGHRIYYVENDVIVTTKEINAKNADSVFVFLK